MTGDLDLNRIQRVTYDNQFSKEEAVIYTILMSAYDNYSLIKLKNEFQMSDKDMLDFIDKLHNTNLLTDDRMWEEAHREFDR